MTFLSLLLFHRFSTARGVEPRVDQISNIRDVSARQENGIVTITFTRPIVSTDTVDDRSLENCTFFMYGWGGPVSFDAQNRPTIGYHPSTPIIPMRGFAFQLWPSALVSNTSWFGGLHFCF